MSIELRPNMIDRHAGPLYRQVADVIREAIVSHDLAPGEPLPSEAALAHSTAGR